MVITLLYRPGQPLKITPDPAYIPKGEPVRWVFATWPAGILRDRNLAWMIYFDGANPFNQVNNLKFDWSPKMAPWLFHPPKSAPQIETAGANEPGDYKYGVQISQVESGKVVSDDDPYLIVR